MAAGDLSPWVVASGVGEVVADAGVQVDGGGLGVAARVVGVGGLSEHGGGGGLELAVWGVGVVDLEEPVVDGDGLGPVVVGVATGPAVDGLGVA